MAAPWPRVAGVNGTGEVILEAAMDGSRGQKREAEQFWTVSEQHKLIWWPRITEDRHLVQEEQWCNCMTGRQEEGQTGWGLLCNDALGRMKPSQFSALTFSFLSLIPQTTAK